MPQHDKPVPQGRIRRTMPLAGFAARAAGGRLVAGLRERTGDDGAVERFHERTAERYTELLGHSKGVLMKAGQILSMVDARALGTGGYWPYQKALTRLQADAPPMHPLLVRKVLEEELGSAVRHFAEFSDEPMAAASIGQVHRAVLSDCREVVVKIQFPVWPRRSETISPTPNCWRPSCGLSRRHPGSRSTFGLSRTRPQRALARRSITATKPP